MRVVKATAIAFFLAMGAALVVLSASAQQPSPAAASNPSWCPGVPLSPPPPHFENFPGDWASANKQCSTDRSKLSPREHHEVDVECRQVCGSARGSWGSSKNPPTGGPSWPLSTDKPQGPLSAPRRGCRVRTAIAFLCFESDGRRDSSVSGVRLLVAQALACDFLAYKEPSILLGCIDQAFFYGVILDVLDLFLQLIFVPDDVIETLIRP
jgi:hypothetical protein